ncbi:MAG TPA: glycoside hydrolase family 99-like domain-containing protein [Candidatus Hydrogenedentes bacterium]|nr:glycoside hydrolase family 99-like domain-containing protein [Candidatus Hydrogenedentota bacterium]
MGRDCQIAVYYFPNYHPDARNCVWHGPGWSEWELVKAATPRFAGHQQPKIPAWGYEDESDPVVMAKKIDAAADHGVDAFLFDWYWYEDGPFLERAIEEGFLKAANADRLKFGLMWANHTWIDIHPGQRSRPANALAQGKVSPEAFRTLTDHAIGTYFAHPSYWRVNDGLYFSTYELGTLLDSLGGPEATRRELDGFRERVRAAGLGELHLNAVVWNIPVLPSETGIQDPNALLEQLGFDSVTSYVWVHHHAVSDFPETAYAAYAEVAAQDYEPFTAKYALPYFPNVTMGWDSSPRTIQSDVYENLGYPYMATLAGNTPAEFKKALERAKAFLDKGLTQPRILTVNAWNEWTEGSYLEPDAVHGMAYLEAIRDVFGR